MFTAFKIELTDNYYKETLKSTQNIPKIHKRYKQNPLLHISYCTSHTTYTHTYTYPLLLTILVSQD